MRTAAVTGRLGLLLLLLSGPVPAAAAQQIGEVSLHAGGTLGFEPEGQGLRPALHASITFVTGRLLLGPELGFYITGPDSLSAGGGPENAFTGGGVVRYRLGSGGYLVGGAGIYWWDSWRDPSGTYFSGSVGAGWQVGGGRGGQGRSGLVLEARLHQLLQNTGQTGTRRFLMIGAGYRLGW